jgi:hypothetical protein
MITELSSEVIDETLKRIWFAIDETVTCGNYEREGQTLLDLYTDKELRQNPELLKLKGGYFYNDASAEWDIYDEVFYTGFLGFTEPNGKGFTHHEVRWSNRELKATECGIDLSTAESI